MSFLPYSLRVGLYLQIKTNLFIVLVLQIDYNIKYNDYSINNYFKILIIEQQINIIFIYKFSVVKKILQKKFVLGWQSVTSTSVLSQRTLSKSIAWSLILAMLLPVAPLWAAGPSGGSVTSGSGSIVQSGNQTTITQNSARMAINWNSFSIDQGSKVTFVQPNASSIALNRITGNLPSQISGQLLANGQVWILNPNGVFINSTGQVNTASFLASTHQLTDQNFQSGNYQFTNGGVTNALVSNQGSIIVADGGYAVLAGRAVRNDGYIQARMGNVVLAGTQSMAIDLLGNRLISFAVGEAVTQAPDDGLALVNNTGTISANGGQVLLTAKAASNLIHQVINTEGVIEAKTAQNVNGQIILDGGTIGQVSLSGTLDTSGLAANQTGGVIKVFGNQISVNGNAMLNASGDVGGGTIWVGGGPEGSGVGTGFTYMPALTTYLSSQSILNASAITNGHGGTIAVWSDITNPLSVTQAYGTLLAMGGAQGGNGGWIETSGHTLNVNGITINTSAPRGITGTWLLDPNDYTITSAIATDISNALNASNVTAQSNSSGSVSGTGNIIINAPITWTSSNTLKFLASNSIFVNSSITATGQGANLQILPQSNLAGSAFAQIVAETPCTGQCGFVQMGNGSVISLTGLNSNLQIGGYLVDVSGGTSTIRANSSNLPAMDLSGTLNLAGNSIITLIANPQVINFSNLFGAGLNVNGSLTINTMTQASGQSLNSVATTLSGPINLLTTNDRLIFGNTVPVVSNSVISGAGGVQISASSTVSMGASNLYTGGTMLQSGTLVTSTINALGTANTNVIFAGGTLQLTGTSQGDQRNYTLAGGTTSTLVLTTDSVFSPLKDFTGTDATPATLNVIDNGTMIIGASNQNLNYAGNISGAGVIQKVGSGTFSVLAGDNTGFTGSFTAISGNVTASSFAVNPFGVGSKISSGGTFIFPPTSSQDSGTLAPTDAKQFFATLIASFTPANQENVTKLLQSVTSIRLPPPMTVFIPPPPPVITGPQVFTTTAPPPPPTNPSGPPPPLALLPPEPMVNNPIGGPLGFGVTPGSNPGPAPVLMTFTGGTILTTNSGVITPISPNSPPPNLGFAPSFVTPSFVAPPLAAPPTPASSPSTAASGPTMVAAVSVDNVAPPAPPPVLTSTSIAQDANVIGGITPIAVTPPQAAAATPPKSETRSTTTVVVTPLAQGIYSQKVTKFRLASSPIMNNSFGGARASF